MCAVTPAASSVHSYPMFQSRAVLADAAVGLQLPVVCIVCLACPDSFQRWKYVCLSFMAFGFNLALQLTRYDKKQRRVVNLTYFLCKT